MKRFLNLFSVLILLMGLCGVANATTIDYAQSVVPDGANGLNGLTSSLGGAIIEDFEGGLLWNWTPIGGGAVVTGSVDGLYSAPTGALGVKELSKYVTVPIGANPGSYNAALGANYNYFGIWWGSIDDYNTIAFYDGINLVASYRGDQLPAPDPANGNQTALNTNRYVNFYGLPSFNNFTMTSTIKAFEADNIAVANVPEPTTMLLLGLGLVGLAGVRRKFKK